MIIYISIVVSITYITLGIISCDVSRKKKSINFPKCFPIVGNPNQRGFGTSLEGSAKGLHWSSDLPSPGGPKRGNTHPPVKRERIILGKPC